jgi:hypothetical protein
MKTRLNLRPKFCVICGEHFELEEGDIVCRSVCYNPVCIQKFRVFCGSGNRFWSKPEFKKKMREKQDDYLKQKGERNKIEVSEKIQ